MELLSCFGLYLGTFAYCVISGVVPFVNAEVFLLYVGSLARPGDMAPLVTAAVLGQMCAKALLYLGGRGVWRLPTGRESQSGREALRTRLSRGRWSSGGLTFVSALLGFPPFYGLSVMAGVFHWPFGRFVCFGTVGRVLRFAAVLYLPTLVKGVSAMNFGVALAIGLLAGAHTATWGMYKDCPYEGFTYRKYLRSILISALLAVGWQLAGDFDLSLASARVVLFGLTYVTERGLVELYKGFLREEDQSKYFIPMQFHVMGRVIHDRSTRWSVAAAWAAGVGFILWMLRSWQHASSHPSPWLVVLAIGSIGGWLSAFGGAFKDAPIEGFETFKFFRSPVLALLWSAFVAHLSADYLYISLCGLGFTVASIETYKTFFFPNKPRGKFAGKPIQHPQLLTWRHRFAPLYAAIWIVLAGNIAMSLSEPTHGLLSRPFTAEK